MTEIYGTGVDAAGEKSAELREKIDSARDRLQEQVAGSVPAAKEAVGKASDATKRGVDKTADVAGKTLDKVAGKTATKKGGEDAAAADEAVPEV